MAEVRSQNGWSCPGRSVIATYTVPGTTLRIPLRKGDVSVVLLEYLRRYHLEVESLYNVPQDLWGYADRPVRGSTTSISNHASGTAVDARAVRHPLGAVNTFTAAQRKALDALVAWFEGVIRHGSAYSGRKDEMHAEINKGAVEVARIAEKIRSQEDDMAMSPAEAQMLRDIHHELTFRLPNRRGPDGEERVDGGFRNDTILGYAANADGYGYRADAALDQLLALVTELAARTQATPRPSPTGSGGVVALSDADVARIAAAVLTELSKRTAA